MRNCLKISLCLLILLFSFSLVPVNSKAATDHLVINEVYYDAVNEPDEEWVEIYNPTNAALDLSGYKIGDEETKGGGEGMYQFPINSIIEKKSYLVIANKAVNFFNLYGVNPSFGLSESESAVPNLSKYSFWANGSISLSNTGDEILLLDSSDQAIDVLVYGNGNYPGIIPSPKVSQGQSLERQPKGQDSDDCALDFIIQPNPNPFIGLPSKIILSLGEIKEQSIELNWTKNLDQDFKNYRIFESLDDKIWTELSLINSSDILNYKVDFLDSGIKYYFKIRVENQENGFWDSNIVSALTKKVYSSAIVVNELFPHPSTGTDNEFIELFNSSNEAVDLSGWILKDGMGSLTTYIISAKIVLNANSYLVFYKKETHISLNDDGDFVSLFWPDGTLVSATAVYKNADKDISWSRNIDGNWLFSLISTPNQANTITLKEDRKDENSDLPLISINEAKKQPKNSWVKVSGIVTVTPGLFGKKVVYIQDGSGGIKIYFDDALWLDLKIGDKVIILGKISTSSGEYQIKVYNASDIVIITHGARLEPTEHKINEINELVGQLIKISGKITKISGSSIWFDDGTGVLRLYYYPATGIKNLGLKEGDWVTVIGVLSKTSGGLRLLPRSKEEIKITKQSKVEVQAEKADPVAQILGAEKAYAASDYRIDSQSAETKKKISYLWGGIVLVIGLLSLASLLIFARIREKHAKDNQFF